MPHESSRTDPQRNPPTAAGRNVFYDQSNQPLAFFDARGGCVGGYGQPVRPYIVSLPRTGPIEGRFGSNLLPLHENTGFLPPQHTEIAAPSVYNDSQQIVSQIIATTAAALRERIVFSGLQAQASTSAGMHVDNRNDIADMLQHPASKPIMSTDSTTCDPHEHFVKLVDDYVMDDSKFDSLIHNHPVKMDGFANLILTTLECRKARQIIIQQMGASTSSSENRFSPYPLSDLNRSRSGSFSRPSSVAAPYALDVTDEMPFNLLSYFATKKEAHAYLRSITKLGGMLNQSACGKQHSTLVKQWNRVATQNGLYGKHEPNAGESNVDKERDDGNSDGE